MRDRGFTLIELLLVIAVIAILVAIIAGLLMNSRSRAQNARLQTDLKQLRILGETYSNQSGSYAGWETCIADPEPTGFTCADDEGVASSVATLKNDIQVRQPDHNLSTGTGDDGFCISLNLLNGNVACTDSTGQFKTDIASGFQCGESVSVCPSTPSGAGAPAGGDAAPLPIDPVILPDT